MIRAYDEYGNVVDLVEREEWIRQDERKKVLDELREMIMNCRFDYSVKIALDVLIDRLLKEQTKGEQT